MYCYEYENCSDKEKLQNRNQKACLYDQRMNKTYSNNIRTKKGRLRSKQATTKHIKNNG